MIEKLLQPLSSLMGRQSKRIQLVEKLVGKRVIDLLLHKPNYLLYRQFLHDLNHAQAGTFVTFKVHVLSHLPRSSPKQTYRILCALTTDTQAQNLNRQEIEKAQKIELCYFHSTPEFLKRLLPVGSLRVVSGRIDYKMGVWSVAHPDHVGYISDIEKWVGFEPIYPLSAGVTQVLIKDLIKKALQLVPNLPEWIDPALIKANNWPSWKQAIHCMHGVPPFAGNFFDDEMFERAVKRIAFDEFLAYQLPIQISYLNRSNVQGPKFNIPTFPDSHEKMTSIINHLPFKLTKSQELVLNEIIQSMSSGCQMHRLLQGDVGSGKTIVAFLAIVHGICNMYQGAFLAPTDILARQHYQTLCKFNYNNLLNIKLITGKDTLREKRNVLMALKSGEVDILVGTHALIQEGVEFKNLGISVIDEQHRFGVDQRLALTAKGNNPHMLVMSATPIPRTMMLSNYGNLDVSILTEKPAGRKPIDTKVVSIDKIDVLLSNVGAKIKNGEKIYWVCPLIEESQTSDLAAATQRHDLLNSIYPDQVGLVHGKMKPQEKEAVMESFMNGQKQILVATSVIEVGVDVPDASIMVIEHAQRFGLAQLHQLRGRIGRGEKNSVCILLYAHPLSNIAKERLAIMKRTNDGFYIAEKDLKLRGGGDTLGAKQSGLPSLKVADFFKDDDLLNDAFKQIKQHIEQVKLKQKNSIPLHPNQLMSDDANFSILLRLFEKEEALKYVRSG